MVSFSQRMGIIPIKDSIQVNSMDDDLRVSLWNAVGGFFFPNLEDHSAIRRHSSAAKLLAQIWVNYFKQPLDDQPPIWSAAKEILRGFFFTCPWNEVYDFVEFVARVYDNSATSLRFMEHCSIILKREMSAFRFVDGQIVRVTSEQEVDAVEEALRVATPLQPVRDHLKQALSLLSDRRTPDYRNSIKESISAVEALCKLVAGETSADLGKALRLIQDSSEVNIHPSLKDALTKLYGYTSDAGGIRHALKDAPTVDYEDAMFMLTTCSAYVSYLLAKAQKAGIAI